MKEPAERSQYVDFLVNRKASKWIKYEIQESSMIMIKSSEGTNFDSRTWTDYHGDHGNGKGMD